MRKTILLLTALSLILALCAGCAGGLPTGSVDAQLELGQKDGGNYANAYFGIACSLDDSWHVSTDEEIRAMGAFVSEVRDDAKAALESGKTVFDLLANREADNQSVNIILSDLGVTYALVEGDTVSLTDADMQQSGEGLKSVGYTNVRTERSTTTFAGKTCALIKLQADLQTETGVAPFYMKQVFLRRGRYLATITVGSLNKDHTEEILSLFHVA